MAQDLLTQRMLALDSGALSDVLDTMGLVHQILSTELRPVRGHMRLAGPAFCIRGASVDGSAGAVSPAGKPKPAFEIDRRLREGCIAVIATGGHREGAVIGGNVSLSYLKHGCRGALVDGPVRDTAELDAQGFAVFAVGTSPLSSKGRFAFLEYDRPISMPGHVCTAVHIDPGDYIFADAEGCLAIPAALVEQVVSDAERLAGVEALIQKALQAGEDRERVYAGHDPRAHIAKVRTTDDRRGA